MASYPDEYDLTEAELEGMTPVASDNETSELSLSDADLEGMAPLSDLDLEGMVPFADSDIGEFSTTPEDTLGEALTKVVETTPSRFKRAGGGLLAMAGDPTLTAKAQVAPLFEAAKEGDIGFRDYFETAKNLAFNLPALLIRGEIKDDSLMDDANQWMSDTGREIAAAAEEEIALSRVDTSDPVIQFAADVAAGTIDMIPALTAGFLTRSPGSSNFQGALKGASFMAPQIAGHTYIDRIDKGVSESEAMDAVKFNILSEVLPETIPFMALMKKGTPFLKRVVDSTLGEGAQEYLTSVLQQTYDNQTLEEMSLIDAIKSVDWKQARYDGLVGIGVGGTLSVPAHIADLASNRNDAPDDALSNIKGKVVNDIAQSSEVLELPAPVIVVTPEGVAATEASMQAAEEIGLRGEGFTMADQLGEPGITPEGTIDFEMPSMEGIGEPIRGTRAGGQFQDWQGGIPFEEDLSIEDKESLADLRGYMDIVTEKGDIAGQQKIQSEIDVFLKDKFTELQLQDPDKYQPIRGKGRGVEYTPKDLAMDLSKEPAVFPEEALPATELPSIPSEEYNAQAIQKTIKKLKRDKRESDKTAPKTVLHDVASRGQIDWDMAIAEGFDPADMIAANKKGMPFGKPFGKPLFKKGSGNGFDSVAEKFSELGVAGFGVGETYQDTAYSADDAINLVGEMISGKREPVYMPGTETAELERQQKGEALDNTLYVYENLLEEVGQYESILESEGQEAADEFYYQQRAMEGYEQEVGGEFWIEGDETTVDTNFDNAGETLANLLDQATAADPEFSAQEFERLVDASDAQIARAMHNIIKGDKDGQAVETAKHQEEQRQKQGDIEAAPAEDGREQEVGEKAAFAQPHEYKTEQYETKAAEHQLSEAQKEAFKPEDERDTVTGMYPSKDRIPTMNRARDYVDANNTEGSYGDIDVRNLGGLNAAFTHTGANKHFKAFADIIAKHADDQASVKFRHGGDEMSVVAPATPVDRLIKQLSAAQAEINKYVEDNNLQDLPHAKHEGKSEEVKQLAKGTGIYFGVSMLDTDVTNSEIIQAAEEQTESQKPKELIALETEEEADGDEQKIEAARVERDEPGTGAERAEQPDQKDKGPRAGEKTEAEQDLEAAVDLPDNSILGKLSSNSLMAGIDLSTNSSKAEPTIKQLNDLLNINLSSPVRLPFRGRVSPFSKGFTYARLADIKIIADLFKKESFVKEGYSSLDVPTQSAVLDSVVRMIRDNKIFRSVVSSVPVDVMNDLAGEKLSTDDLFNDGPMFIGALSIDSDLAVRGSAIDAIIGSLASPIAKDSAEDLAVIPVENGSTAKTSDIRHSDSVEQAEKNTATHPDSERLPTEGQIKSGNYRLGHVKINGLDISIENPKDSIRSGTDDNDTSWSVKMQHPYGYIKGTVGADSETGAKPHEIEQVDVFIGDNTESEKVFVIDQINPKNGAFDEHKVVIGANSADEASEIYSANYSKDWKGFGDISEMELTEFKKWLDGDTTKPVAYEMPAPELELADQTEAEIQADEQVAAEEKKKEAEIEKKAEVDEGVDEFALTGSEREADIAAAAGQEDLLVEPAEEKPRYTASESASGWMVRDRIGAELKTMEFIRLNPRGSSNEFTVETKAEAQRIADQRNDGWKKQEAERAAEEKPDDAKATEVLDAANVRGKDRLDAMSKFRSGEYSLDDLTAAYPATEPAPVEEEKIEYPIADKDEWYGDADYIQRGGEMVNMSPDEYLERVRPLEIDEESRENIDILKAHIEEGKTLDPLAIYEDGSEDGRHRAHAAKELGIKSVPVILFGEQIEKKAAPAEKITDVGEKIGGARKDVWSGFREKATAEISDDEILRLPLSKIFPEPDYAKLAEQGADPMALALIKSVRDEIPAKGRTNYKKRQYLEKVNMVRKTSADILDSPEYAKRFIDGLRENRELRSMAERVDLMLELGFPASGVDLKGVTLEKVNFSLYKGEKDVTKWLVDATAKSRRSIGGMGGQIAATDTREEAIDALKTYLENEAAKPKGAKITKFEVYKYRGKEGGKRGWIVGKKVGKNMIDLNEGFETSGEARAYADLNNDELVEKLAKRKEIPAHRRPVNEVRLGEDYRAGKDIDANEFMETFGFRGVEFGNWVEQKKRQQDINDAYDGLMDLAKLLDIPPKAISLNGELGMAFGARGRGAAGGGIVAKAHYEKDKIVINLTKKSGAGSLAHEWFHGLDNYFSRRRGANMSYVTDRPYELMDKGVRPEVLAKLKGIVDAIKDSGLPKRAAELDGRRSKPYWATTIEMAARSFESYVINKLKDKGVSNDYLANIVSPEYWTAAEALGLEAENSYPYIMKDELEAINDAFDDLFDTVETKETDEGVMLFSATSFTPNKSSFIKGITEAQAEEALKIFLKEMGKPSGVKIFIAPTKKSAMTDEVYSKFKKDQVRGFYKSGTEEIGGGRIVLILEDIESVEKAVNVLRHEWVAHHGLNTFNPSDKKKIINRIRSSKGEMSLKAAWAHVESNYPNASPDIQAEELLAYMAENKATRLSKLWNDLVLMVQNALKKMGIIGKGKITKAEVVRFVEDLASRVGAGAAQQTYEGEVAYSKDEVRPEADTSIMYSKRTPKETVSAIDAKSKGSAETVQKFFRRYFTKEGLLPKAGFEAKILKDSEKNVGESDLSVMVHDFEKDMAAAYGVSYNKISDEDLLDVNRYLAGDKGIALPKGLHSKLDHMRAYLDRLSGGMQVAMTDMLKIEASKLSDSEAEAFGRFLANDGEGRLPNSMKKHWNLYQTIEKNKGTYLNRSYQAFNDEKWINKVKMNGPLMARARAFIAKERPELSPDEVIGSVNAILEAAYDSGNFMSFMSSGSKLGSKDTSIIAKKKEVPKVIRELLGEYKDPKVNFVNSASKMQYFVANHNFLMSLRNEGLGVFLFESPTGEYAVEVAGDASETMNPLNGLYSNRDFVTALQDASGAEQSSDFMRRVIQLNSIIKYGKTILSVTTQARNFQSAMMFSVMNGHFDWSHAKKAYQVAKADMFTKDAEWRKYINNLIGLGVIHNNPYAGEMRDAIEDFMALDTYKKGFMQNPKKFLNFMQKAYQVGDDFWKIIGFENELQMQIEAGLSPSEAEKKAAYRIRNGYPTYSMVPKGIKFVRRAPLVGTFVSFPYEIVRTSYNQIGFLKEDIKAGNKKLASRRVLGMAIALSAAHAASVASMMLMGIDDEDDEAVRKLLPPWSRNSQLIYTGYDENGMPTYYDISYIDPYTYLKKPISAILNGNNVGLNEKIADSMMEILEPFVGVDIGAGALLQLYSNRKDTGGKIWNEQAPDADKVKAILNHIRKAVQPGTLSNMERIILAMQDERSRGGKQYTISDETWALLGHRFSTLNIPQAMVYKSYEFIDAKKESSMLLSYIAGSASKLSSDDIKSATEKMLTARKKVYNDMSKIVKAGKQLNVSEDDLAGIMEASGIGADDVDYILDGEVPPWDMPFTYGEKGLDRAVITAHDEERKAEIEAMYEQRLEIIDSVLDEWDKSDY